MAKKPVERFRDSAPRLPQNFAIGLPLVILGVLALSVGIRAQSLEESSDAPPQIDPLAMLVGSWEAQEQIWMGEREVRGVGKMRGKWGPGRHSVILEYASVEGPMKGFELTEIIARGAGEGQYSLAWVHAFAPGIDSRQGRYSAGVFSFAGETKQVDGVEVVENSSIEAREVGFVIRSTRSRGNGKPEPSMILTFAPSSENVP